jgi:hypothetical protein
VSAKRTLRDNKNHRSSDNNTRIQTCQQAWLITLEKDYV